MRVAFFQFGDFSEAFHRLGAGGPETYRDQRHSVDYVASLVPEHELAIVSIAGREYDEELAPGLRSIGVTAATAWDRKQLRPILDRLDPEAVVCRAANAIALGWAADRRVPTLPTFANIFMSKSPREILFNLRVRFALRRCLTPCVANHSLSASRSLRRVGVASDRIVPWEFRRMSAVDQPKDAPSPERPFRLFYAGVLSESKGVGDCIRALAILRGRRGADVELSLAGPGDAGEWASLARGLGVEGSVRLLGTIPSERVTREMREHDAVVVPSRHAFPEGLPNTVFEALASRCPLVASDHPSFVNRLRAGVDSLRFREKDADGLADQVESLMREPDLYARLSGSAPAALAGLYVGIEWTELIGRFLRDPRDVGGWTRELSLSAIEDARRPRLAPVPRGLGVSAS